MAIAAERGLWQEHSACRSTDPEMFFPVGTTGNALDAIDRAKAVCTECTVQEECLDYALHTNQEAGVWGGYAEDERRRLRKRWLAERRKRAS
ncbi:MAG: WhiB family transcriptional regulator [Acidimicrobiia bacterium]|nr:WhiB family transcriptional regulator [Acidimicrobiia bacterium]